ncbi:MAG: hypothetical protein H6642_07805 [Caldilineaceae bacterium]|nr:hypothetical protein [Caldilineaceae bacterium]
MNETPLRQPKPAETGLARFALEVADLARSAAPGRQGTRRFIIEIGERYAYIHLGDMMHPLRFLRQMAGAPPVTFGVSGFRPAVVDDANPARHYTAFVWTGYWLPLPLAILALYAWEAAGYFRYGFHWSRTDMHNGRIGLRHGRAVRRDGPAVLARLIIRDLADPNVVDEAELLAEVKASVA